ncbi:MAG: Clp protease N-terminal domain-containing protein [Acidobacteriia bacterium]|nr:Clp protease N-terminal domain-containing protein [Terriglobia bacterium]
MRSEARVKLEQHDISPVPFIDTHHIVLGILRQEKSLGAKLLSEAGINLASARQLAAGKNAGKPASAATQSNLPPMVALLMLGVLITAIYFIVRIALGR